jgi:uncharacterized membrane-anchored protein
MRNKLLWTTLLLILAVVNGAIYSKEQLLARGETLLLELAPRDPRSLLQGDYMALRYRVADEIVAAIGQDVSDGRAVMTRDAGGVARFTRLHGGETLSAGEQLLRFRKRGRVVRLASDAWFFQEGQAAQFEPARYGELKVDAGGEAVLVALRDAERRRLPLAPAQNLELVPDPR